MRIRHETQTHPEHYRFGMDIDNSVFIRSFTDRERSCCVWSTLKKGYVQTYAMLFDEFENIRRTGSILFHHFLFFNEALSDQERWTEAVANTERWFTGAANHKYLVMQEHYDNQNAITQLTTDN